MKKLFLIFIAIYFCSFCFISCAFESSAIDKPTTNLEFWVGDKIDDTFRTEHEFSTGGFGSDMYYGLGYHGERGETGDVIDPEKYVKYSVGGYPDESSEHNYIVQIFLNDPKVNIYDFNFGMPRETFVEIFSKNGYSEQSENQFHATVTSGKVSVTLYDEYLMVSIEVTDVTGIVY